MKTIDFITKIAYVLMLIPIACFSQDPLPIDKAFPTGKQGEIIQEFIDVVNNESDYLTNSNALLEQIEELRSIAGKISFIGVFKPRILRDQQTILIVEDENYNLWRGISIRFSDKTKTTIESMNQRIFPKPAPKTKISEKQALQKVAKKLITLDKKDLFSGTVLIAKGDKILYKEACGKASKRFNVPNTITTKFNIASIGKMFTAVAMMQLVEQNKISLEDTLDNYLDSSWLSKEKASKITIKHLLSHTSGLGSYFSDEFFNSSKENYRDIDDFKPIISKDSLSFPPGSRFKYSNSGFLLLGVVIEKITGASYEHYIDNNIYKPLKMTNSGLYEMDQPVKNIAIGYVKTKKNNFGWENNLYKHIIKGGPAGGGYSTVNDLHKFMLALKTHMLLSKNSLDMLWAKPDNIRTRYGLGFYVLENPIEKTIGHSGGAPGISAEVLYNLNKDYITVVLSNYNDGEQVSFYLRDIVNHLK